MLTLTDIFPRHHLWAHTRSDYIDEELNVLNTPGAAIPLHPAAFNYPQTEQMLFRVIQLKHALDLTHETGANQHVVGVAG